MHLATPSRRSARDLPRQSLTVRRALAFNVSIDASPFLLSPATRTRPSFVACHPRCRFLRGPTCQTTHGGRQRISVVQAVCQQRHAGFRAGAARSPWRHAAFRAGAACSPWIVLRRNPHSRENVRDCAALCSPLAQPSCAALFCRVVGVLLSLALWQLVSAPFDGASGEEGYLVGTTALIVGREPVFTVYVRILLRSGGVETVRTPCLRHHDVDVSIPSSFLGTQYACDCVRTLGGRTR